MTIAAGVRAGELSPVDLAAETIAGIRAGDGEINAFTCVLEEEALAAARAVEARVAAGDEPGPLAGVPVSIKDVIWMTGAPASNGSLPYRDFHPAEDAVIVGRVREAGAGGVGTKTDPARRVPGA